MDEDRLEETVDTSSPLAPGTIVGGKYTIDECVGVGSKCTVYKCHQAGLRDTVFIMKMLHPDLVNDEVVSARFEKEIMTAYGVSHQNVIRLFDCIKDEKTLAYTMEYAGGGSLKDLLKSKENFSIERCIIILEQLGSGLQAIHAKGIVHRDLKPKNVLFMEDQTLKIADFGLVHTSSGKKLTAQGEVLGAVDFVSPEYLKSGEIDQRSDIYAVGLIAYELITGSAPFKGSTLMDTLMKRLSTDPEHPMRKRLDCPPELDKLVMKALSREPEQRYQNAGEMVVDLERLRLRKTGKGNELNPELLKSSSESSIKSKTRRPPANSASNSRKSKKRSSVGRFVILALLIMAAIGYVTAYLLPRDKLATSPEIRVVNQETPEPDLLAAPIPEMKPINPHDLAAVLGGREEGVMISEEIGQGQEVSPLLNEEPLIEPTAPPPPKRNLRHRIVLGDTLSAISRRYNVPVEEIMVANGLDDPRKLVVGMELAIP